MMETCEMPKCRRPATIGYLGLGLCQHHWQRTAALEGDALRELQANIRAGRCTRRHKATLAPVEEQPERWDGLS
jgi:hypothetical protein